MIGCKNEIILDTIGRLINDTYIYIFVVNNWTNKNTFVTNKANTKYRYMPYLYVTITLNISYNLLSAYTGAWYGGQLNIICMTLFVCHCL